MRVTLQIALCCLLAAGAMAQRAGGGIGRAGGAGIGRAGGAGIGRAGGMGGGLGRVGGYGGGRVGGGAPGGGYGGFLGSNNFRGSSGFRGGYYPRNYGYRGSYGYGGFYGSSWWPSYGLGFSYYPYYSDYGYAPYDYGYGSGYAAPAAYQPNVTVVYPEQQSAPATYYPASPVMRRYDEYGQETSSGASANSSPLYLIAFQDHIIRPALSYSVTGDTLHYVTLDREEKQVPLDSVDRALSRQLNRERRVAFSLPGQ